MYDGKPVRNRKGEITQAAAFQSSTPEAGEVARIAPNRKWFGNTRTIAQKDLEKFRDEMTQRVNDSYSIVLHQQKLPMGLLASADEKVYLQFFHFLICCTLCIVHGMNWVLFRKMPTSFFLVSDASLF
jgi:hypothetical protein